MWTMNHRMMLKVSPILINPQRDPHTAASSFIASSSSVLLFCSAVCSRSRSATFSSRNQQYTNTLNSQQQVNSWWLHGEDPGILSRHIFLCSSGWRANTGQKKRDVWNYDWPDDINVTQISNLVSLLVSGLSSALAQKLYCVCVLNKMERFHLILFFQ